MAKTGLEIINSPESTAEKLAAIMANAIFVGTVWAKPNALDITPAVLNGLELSTVENLVTNCSSEYHFFHNIYHLFYKSVGGW